MSISGRIARWRSRRKYKPAGYSHEGFAIDKTVSDEFDETFFGQLSRGIIPRVKRNVQIDDEDREFLKRIMGTIQERGESGAGEE